MKLSSRSSDLSKFITCTQSNATFRNSLYYPVDISTTVFSYSHAVQYHAILHGAGVIARGVIARALGLRTRYPSNYDVL